MFLEFFDLSDLREGEHQGLRTWLVGNKPKNDQDLKAKKDKALGLNKKGGTSAGAKTPSQAGSVTGARSKPQSQAGSQPVTPRQTSASAGDAEKKW